MSCKNDKIRRRTRALDASTTEAARGGLINHLLNRVRKDLHCSYRLCFLPTQNNRKPDKTKQHTHSAKEQRSTTDTFRCNGRRLYVSRGQHFRNMCHTCDAFHKASRQNASRRTWAGSGRRLAMDCVTREKPCLRICHGITHKQRRTHTELPIASLFPVPLPSADTENTRKMVSRDQLCHYSFKLIRKNKSAPRQIYNYFGRNGILFASCNGRNPCPQARPF